MLPSLPDSTLAGPAAGHADSRQTTGIAFTWLLLLRWGAVACQILLITAIHFLFHIRLPLLIVSGIILFQAASNLVFAAFRKKKKWLDRMLIAGMFMDVLLLTLLLYYTGGPMNPFTSLYLVHIVIASIILRPKMVWLLFLFTVACYAALFQIPGQDGIAPFPIGRTVPVPLCHTTGGTDPGKIRIHLQGMLLAFVLTAVFIVFFVSKIQQSLHRYQEAVVSLNEEKNRNERLASLATLSAGAAHELSTPLSLIAVVAGEMYHTLLERGEDDELVQDARLIRQQVDICKDILYHMTADAGQPMGEQPLLIRLPDLLAELGRDFAGERLRLVNRADDLVIQVPPRTMKRALSSLVRNALDAGGDTEVILTCFREGDRLAFRVEDSGIGMDEETLARATEPFFSTRKPGRGMGLGLFLARSVGERYGGGLVLESDPGSGTRATLYFALDRIQPA
ncbi:MAG TPA: HAMP domain-containing histidine kinase [Desulfobulbus sp.]|nr:HAMP domain-containing histidine kinase [Desulfobulbus sp.]